MTDERIKELRQLAYSIEVMAQDAIATAIWRALVECLDALEAEQAKVAKLRDALEAFAYPDPDYAEGRDDDYPVTVYCEAGDTRRAIRVLKETE